MAKSAVNLDVNIVLSMFGFIGVARRCGLCKYIVGHPEISIFTCIYLNLQKLCDKNAILSKDTAGRTQYFERILHFQREIVR